MVRRAAGVASKRDEANDCCSPGRCHARTNARSEGDTVRDDEGYKRESDDKMAHKEKVKRIYRRKRGGKTAEQHHTCRSRFHRHRRHHRPVLPSPTSLPLPRSTCELRNSLWRIRHKGGEQRHAHRHADDRRSGGGARGVWVGEVALVVARHHLRAPPEEVRRCGTSNGCSRQRVRERRRGGAGKGKTTTV